MPNQALQRTPAAPPVPRECLVSRGRPVPLISSFGCGGLRVAEVSGIETYRDGGTTEFVLSASRAAGLYRLRSPLHDPSRTLSRDGVPLPPGSAGEAAVLGALRDWLDAEVGAGEAAALAELSLLREWLNLPERLSRVTRLWYIRRVVEVLGGRCDAEPGAAADTRPICD